VVQVADQVLKAKFGTHSCNWKDNERRTETKNHPRGKMLGKRNPQSQLIH
jgi:hypothetical protein